MRLPIRTLVVLWASALPILPSSAPAGSVVEPEVEFHATWIDPVGLQLQRVLPPPPSPGSRAGAEDLAAVQAAVAARTAADERRITADVPRTYDRFAATLGPAYAAARVPKLARLIGLVFQDGELAVWAAKADFRRIRPYTLDPDLRTFGARSTHWSYPSGHTTFAYLTAIVLSTVVPDRRDALFARAWEIAYDRVLAGVHFPTDLEGGKIAAAVIGEALLRDAGFRRALAEAAAEVGERIGTGP